MAEKIQTWTKNEGFGEYVEVDRDAEFECGADLDLGHDTQMILATYFELNGGPRALVVVRPDETRPQCEVLVPTRIEALLLMQEFLPLLQEIRRREREEVAEYNRGRRTP